MRRALASLYAWTVVLALTIPVYANASTSCTVTPHPLEALEVGTLTATGLPAGVPVALYTGFVYDGHPTGYSDVDITPDPDGSWSEPVVWSLSGKAQYRFVNDASGIALASCNVLVK